MANYHTTICYIFEKEEAVRKLFSEIIDEKDSAKYLNMNKVAPIPDGLSKEDGAKWADENWGALSYTEFEYSIFEKYSTIELEGRYSVFPELFVNLSKNFSVPVLVIYYTEGFYGNGLRFIDHKKEIQIGYDVPDFGTMKVFSNINAINFQALGVEEDVYGCLRNNTPPIENDGCDRVRRRKEHYKEDNKSVKPEKENNSSEDGGW